MKGSRKAKALDEHVINTLKGAGLEGEELAKYAIIWKGFYQKIRPCVQKLTTKD